MDTSITQAFLEGMQEVFSTMFTDQIFLKLMDLENTEVNIYGESADKVYREPVQLVGKIVLSNSQEDTPESEIRTSATIRIPTKEFIDKEISFYSQEDLETLKKGLIVYREEEYEIQDVVPCTNITDTYMFYDFTCLRKLRKRG